MFDFYTQPKNEAIISQEISIICFTSLETLFWSYIYKVNIGP